MFSLSRWSCWIHSEFLVFRVTWVSIRESHIAFAYGTITLYGLTFQNYSANNAVFDSPTYWYFSPDRTRNTGSTTRTRFNVHAGLDLFPFARRYLGNHGCFLFLRLLRCFSSPRSLHTPMYSVYDRQVLPCWVTPFGNPRLKGCLLLIEAYRSLPRPSSPLRAKASTVCS